MRRLTVVVLLFFLPTLLEAQVRGGAGAGRTMISAPHVVGRSGAVGVRPATSAPFAYRSSPARSQGGVVAARRLGSQAHGRPYSANTFVPDFTAAPGLGFDYVHYAATHPGAGRRRFGNGAGYFPFFDAGFLLPYAPIYASDQQEDAPYAVQPPQDPQAVANDGGSSARRYPGYGLEAVSSYDVIVSPQKPSESYVFVRRDGTLFFAVAYSWAEGTLYYVTQEGLRRSVGRDALDLDATQQFNEQRGLSFRSPA